MPIKHLSSISELDSTLSSAGSKTVIIDFFATWCGPCHAIAPTFQALSEKNPGSVFCKVDVDAVPAAAQRYSVRAMPTFLFIKNGSVVETLKGANPGQLTSLVAKHSGSSSFSGTGNTLSGSSTGGSSAPSANGLGNTQSQNSLLSLVSTSQCSALNEDPSHTLNSIIKGPSGGKWLQSDADEQLIIDVSFMQKIRLSSFMIRTTPSSISSAPLRVKVFSNRPGLSFDDAESETAGTEVELKEEDVKAGTSGGGGKPVPVKFVKFQNIDSVQIAVLSNQGGEPSTRIDAIDFYGTSTETTNMADLKKMDAEAEAREWDFQNGRGPSKTGLKGGSSRGSSRSYQSGASSVSSATTVNQNTHQQPVRKRSGSGKSSAASMSPERDGFAPGLQSASARRSSDPLDFGLGTPSSIPLAPPSLAALDSEADPEVISDHAFGGWQHYLPLIIALAPPLTVIVGGKAEAWSDALLLILATFWLYQFLRVPWEMYSASRTRRILALDAIFEDGEESKESPERIRTRELAASELRKTELISLGFCLISPLIGAWILNWMQESLTDGERYLNTFNIRLFTLAAGLKPWLHLFSLMRKRILFLQEEVHYPSSQVEMMSRRMKRLEADLSSLRKLYATKADVRTLRDGIDVPLTQLSRAVKRYEKKEEHLRMSSDDKFGVVESRLEDLLREVAINAELLEEERRERERNQSLPVSLINAFKLVLGSREASSHRHQIYDSSRSLPPASSIGLGSPDHQPHSHLHRGPQQVNGASFSVATANSTNLSANAIPVSPPNYAPMYQVPQNPSPWYQRGAMYYIFLPLNASSAAIKYAGDKVSGAIGSNAAEYAYAHQQQHHHALQSAAQNHHGHSRRLDKH